MRSNYGANGDGHTDPPTTRYFDLKTEMNRLALHLMNNPEAEQAAPEKLPSAGRAP